MEPVESRSDSRSRFIPASPARVFAAMRDPARVARWWGPAGFTNTIHTFEFEPGGSWLLTMHGPDGKDYPNESRFTRIVADKLFEIEHLNGHHFVLTLELLPQEQGTLVAWRQTFDTSAHYGQLKAFVASANEQNLERLAAEVVERSDMATSAPTAPPRRFPKKTPASDAARPASELIDARIRELADWRGALLSHLRRVITQADATVTEEWKWNTPVWASGGIICTGETYRKAVKLTFAKGASLADPARLFNSSLEGNTRRAIDYPEGAVVDDDALTALVRAAVALNVSTGQGKPKRGA